MNFNVISLFPEMIEGHFSGGVIGQALTKRLIQLDCINPRQFTRDFHKTVDDRPYGGGDGMVLLAEPLSQAVQSIKTPGPVIYMSPQGNRWSDQKARDWSKKYQNITLVCGRYGGVDQRFIDEYVDEEISIGDYVLSGGELAALVLMDSVARMIPEVLGHSDSADKESFAQGLLEAPLYTRPQVFKEKKVPQVLLEGHHQRIEAWRYYQSLKRTQELRPNLFAQNPSFAKDLRKLETQFEGCTTR